MGSPNAFIVGLEQGVVTLLGSKSSVALLKMTRPSELILTTLALVALMRAVPDHLMVAGRVSRLMGKVLVTVSLNAVLQAISNWNDVGLASLNLIAVYFVAGALDPDGNMSITAQYLLVSNLSLTLQGFHHGELLPLAWSLAFVDSDLLQADLADLAYLVTTESFSVWLRDWFPQSLLMFSTVALLYLCAPFVDQFPFLDKMYRYAVFSFTKDFSFVSVPVWLMGAGLLAVYQLETDKVSRRLAVITGCNLAVLGSLDILRFAMDNDPAPTLIALLLTIRIFESSL
jgi:hypothetical protein